MLPQLVLTLALLTPVPTPGARACSNDSFTIDGTPVSVSLCVPVGTTRHAIEGKPSSVDVAESFSARGETFARTVALDFLSRPEYSRSIDDVSLARLGIAKSLHLTVGWKPGSVRLEHALLTPGAFALK